ncbi:MAG: hypothetical protein FXF47_00380 [Candidatus Mcinerneyibacterium aminivorans]|uniref:Uncharacterized protein n=1 Tax=Candidatus Mcinerneyibacterium aminivorans TaxID=2703815 RepID=A0A5D0MEX5_9BACT|nr:MAG: hypothetical protein FXF47_00380 [Candidatus Mcinerneyibacterium aminivorans]
MSFIIDGRQKELDIQMDKYLRNTVVLNKNKPIVRYISFFVNHKIDEKYEYIELIFINFKGKKKKIKINSSDMGEGKYLFDDCIWKER